MAEEHVSLEEVSSDGVFRRSDDGQLFHFMTVEDTITERNVPKSIPIYNTSFAIGSLIYGNRPTL